MGLTFKTLMHGINVHRLMNKLNIQTLMSSIVTSVPSVTNVYYFFMDCRDAYCFVRCGFVYVNVCCRAAAWPRICGAAHACCRALVMLPRTRMLPLIYGAAFVYAAARLCSCASVVPRTPMVPRSIVPRTCMPPLTHGAACAAKWFQVLCG